MTCASCRAPAPYVLVDEHGAVSACGSCGDRAVLARERTELRRLK